MSAISAHALVTALRNERVLRKRPFAGFPLPGPEPVLELPTEKILVDKEGKRLLIGMDDFIKIVEDTLKRN